MPLPTRGRRGLKAVGPLIGPLLAVLAWYAVTSLRLVNPRLLPGPAETLVQFARIWTTADYLLDIATTLGRMGAGFGLAVLVGVATGLVLGSHSGLYRAVTPLLDFGRSIPVTAVYPIFIIVFGIGGASKVAMVFAASVFVIILNTALGVRAANPMRAAMARLYGATRWQVFRRVVLYDSLFQTLIGIRTSLSLALVVEIVCEMFMGSRRGLGQRLFDSYNTFSSDVLFALVLVAGTLGYALNAAFIAVERRLVHWNRR